MIVRIATFNCEWRRTTSADTAIIRERVMEGGADIVCLTETHRDYLDGEGFTITSALPSTGPNAASRRKVLLWSPNPWSAVDEIGHEELPEGRYVSGTTNTPAGELRVIGVVIPYSFAGVQYGLPKRRLWELHLRFLEALAASLPASPARTVLVGDFNQRVPRKHQPQHIFDSMQAALLGRLSIATAGVLAPVGRQAIDHVCHSSDLACRAVESISNERPGGGQISDHFGVRVELVAGHVGKDP